MFAVILIILAEVGCALCCVTLGFMFPSLVYFVVVDVTFRLLQFVLDVALCNFHLCMVKLLNS